MLHSGKYNDDRVSVEKALKDAGHSRGINDCLPGEDGSKGIENGRPHSLDFQDAPFVGPEEMSTRQSINISDLWPGVANGLSARWSQSVCRSLRV